MYQLRITKRIMMKILDLVRRKSVSLVSCVALVWCLFIISKMYQSQSAYSQQIQTNQRILPITQPRTEEGFTPRIKEQDLSSNKRSSGIKIVANAHDFTYVINNPQICQNKDVFIIAFVHSAPSHFSARERIRATWGQVKTHSGLSIHLFFMLGVHVSDNQSIQNRIYDENRKYKDIIQENFLDQYRNLTYKHIAGLKWINTYCKHAKFVLKTDEDTLVNIYNLIKFLLEKHRTSATKDFVYCSVFQRIAPRRDKEDKWYVSYDEFSRDLYPPYCEGFAYIMSTDLVPKLYNESLYTKYYWIDDVYVTGLLMEKLGIQHTMMHEPFAYELMKAGTSNSINNMFLLAKYHGDDKHWTTLWNKMKQAAIQ